MKRKMSSKTSVFLVLTLCIIMGIIVFIVLLQKQRITENFYESRMELSNPGRGYYWQVESSSKEEFSDLEEEGYRLTLLTFDIEGIKEEIDQERLLELDEALAEAKNHHFAVIFRAAYGFEGIPNEPRDLETIGTHISQISSVLNKYSDNILCVQAGLLGAYGEWHSGEFLTQGEEEARKARKYVLEHWEEYLAEEIEVSVRRPRFIREAEGLLEERLGVHNDALLSTFDDMGTYDDGWNRQEELAWVDGELLQRKNGGEMPLWGEYSQPQNADLEFSKMHISYLNRSYQADIFEQWKNLELKGENAEEFIKNHLGYRLYISETNRWREVANFPANLLPIDFKITLVNSGYAPLDHQFKVFMVTETSQQRNVQELNADSLYSICNGQGSLIDVDLGITGLQLNGNKIKIGIKIAGAPDADERDCVRLANEEVVWEDGVNWMFEY